VVHIKAQRGQLYKGKQNKDRALLSNVLYF
jgi:hypothetical protein